MVRGQAEAISRERSRPLHRMAGRRSATDSASRCQSAHPSRDVLGRAARTSLEHASREDRSRTTQRTPEEGGRRTLARSCRSVRSGARGRYEPARAGGVKHTGTRREASASGARPGKPAIHNARDVVSHRIVLIADLHSLLAAAGSRVGRPRHVGDRDVVLRAVEIVRHEGARSQGTSPCPQLARHFLHFPGKSRRVVPRRTNRSRTRRRVRSYCSSRGRSARRIPSSELGRRLAARVSVAAKLWRQTRTQGAVRGGQLVEIGTWLAV